MSKWTHIAGIIRIDDFSLNVESISERSIERLIAEGSPTGSEGGLDFKARKTQLNDPPCFEAVWGYISFGGDLRDFHIENLNEVREWLNTIVKRLQDHACIIRQGVIHIDPEYDPSIIIVYDWETEEWKEFIFKIGEEEES